MRNAPGLGIAPWSIALVRPNLPTQPSPLPPVSLRWGHTQLLQLQPPEPRGPRGQRRRSPHRELTPVLGDRWGHRYPWGNASARVTCRGERARPDPAFLVWLFSLKERDFRGQQGSPALLHRASCVAVTLGGTVPPARSAKGGTRPASPGPGDKTRAPAAPEAWQSPDPPAKPATRRGRKPRSTREGSQAGAPVVFGALDLQC